MRSRSAALISKDLRYNTPDNYTGPAYHIHARLFIKTVHICNFLRGNAAWEGTKVGFKICQYCALGNDTTKKRYYWEINYYEGTSKADRFQKQSSLQFFPVFFISHNDTVFGRIYLVSSAIRTNFKPNFVARVYSMIRNTPFAFRPRLETSDRFLQLVCFYL